jgi:hypothetical protein
MAKRGPQYSQKERLAIVKEGEKVGIKRFWRPLARREGSPKQEL